MIFKSLAAVGLLGFAALPGMRSGLIARRTTILMYHDLCDDDAEIEAWAVVRRTDFLGQLTHLRSHYEIVSLDEALDARNKPRARPLAVLTFDDGLVGNHDVLLPIVEAERVPVAVYVATSHIENCEGYWFDRLVNAVQTTRPLRLELGGFGLGSYSINTTRGAGNWAEIQRLLADLKAHAPEQQLAITAYVEQVTAPLQRADGVRLRPMKLEALQRLAASRHVTIGAHTHCHSLLTTLPLAQARDSIVRSRELLRRWTGQAVEHFAYPSGAYDDQVVRLVEELGFRSAVTTENGLWSPHTSPMRVPRVAVGRYDNAPVFQLNLFGGLRNLARLAVS